MSLTLKNIKRDEMLSQLKYIKEHADCKCSKVEEITRTGERRRLVRVREDDGSVFLCMAREGNPIIELSNLLGEGMHEIGLDELIDILSRCNGQDVYMQWPFDEPHTVVGKVFAFSLDGKSLSVMLVPVPKDIEDVNERVRLICAEMCEKASGGMMCGDCDMCGVCEILSDADRVVTEDRTNGGE